MKLNRNRKRRSGSFKKLYDIICIILALSCIKVLYKGWCVSKQVVCHILAMFILKLYLMAIR